MVYQGDMKRNIVKANARACKVLKKNREIESSLSKGTVRNLLSRGSVIDRSPRLAVSNRSTVVGQ